MTDPTWVVHKFGGSSLADADCIRRVTEIVLGAAPDRCAVIVSAIAGFTDALLGMIDEAERGRELDRVLGSLGDQYTGICRELLPTDRLTPVLEPFTQDMRDIHDVLRAVSLVRSASERTRDVVAGFGEVWSARLLCEQLRSIDGDDTTFDWLDARRVVTVRQAELGPVVCWDRSRAAIAEMLSERRATTVVVTGYVAQDEQGLATTLGRNGSDFSASIFGALLEAEAITIWTDVDGVMSGDPRRIPEASVIESMSYDEAMELAYFGARVLHPQTMAPAVERQIPIYIRNTFAPSAPGTRIWAGPSPATGPVKGITSIDGLCLVNVEGTGMMGVPGTAHRLFGALREAGISVVLISQASSEHSICFVVPARERDGVRRVVETAFAAEFSQGQIQRLDVSDDASILAVVGDGMAGTPGIAATFFSALARAGVNVKAIAQGSSERNISAVIDTRETNRAVRAVHAGYYLSSETLSIGLIGPGTVGSVFLDQLASQVDRLARELALDLRVRGILTSRRLLCADRVDLGNWRDALASSSETPNPDTLVAHIDADHIPHAVMIDCTASGVIADRYEEWLRRGVHVVTPNKKGLTGSWEAYCGLKEAGRAAKARLLYETTVGAGLPILHTLRDLRETGDEITSIAGVLSGTLSYLFNLYDGSRPFSTIVADARAAGFTEPDPRDDLTGMDVARKVVILGREMGLPLSLDDVEVESLVATDLIEGTVDEFLAGLPKYDDTMHRRWLEAKERDEVIRYVGRLDASGRASVSLERLPTSHPFANLNLTDNIVEFVTGRYVENPLIVRGPGAGPAVTAAGVFADLLRLSSHLGAAV